jgi:hypothetical protein
VGPVVLDLKGYTITGTGGYSVGIGIWPLAYPYSNLYPITVRNGTLNKFGFGVYAISQYGLTTININSLQFLLDTTGVYFQEVQSSTVHNCTFNGSIHFIDGSIGNAEPYGIYDYDSQGGNHYTNDTFIDIDQPIVDSTAVVRDSDGEAVAVVRKLNDCYFAAPTPRMTPAPPPRPMP